MTLLNTANLAVALLITVFLAGLVFSSLLEREWRASVISLLMLASNILFWSLILTRPPGTPGNTLNILLLVLLALGAGISLLEFFPRRNHRRERSRFIPYDERDHMFSRNQLQNHPEIRARYYRNHPELESEDRRIHSRPELGERGHLYYDEYASAVFASSFDFLERSIPLSRGETTRRPAADIARVKKTLTEAARFYGVADVGFTALKEHHLYSIHGRRADRWGEPVTNTHRSAMVILAPMSTGMIKQAPTLPAIQESARRYVQLGVISNILAGILRRLGTDARAHNDGNYEVLCVPLAIDAGLGELGRMGILMHPVYGPCVRLAAVTTDLDLGQSPRAAHSIPEFCRICRKCADNCPSGAIARGREPESRGFPHWSIRQERCFGYWKKVGTDCGLCIAVCPYSKPDTFVHRLVRFYISRNMINQRIALFFDDLLYGRKYRIQGKNPRRMFALHNSGIGEKG